MPDGENEHDGEPSDSELWRQRLEHVESTLEDPPFTGSAGCFRVLLGLVFGTVLVLSLLAYIWDNPWWAGGGSPPTTPSPQTLQSENTFNSEGNLIPIPGEWQMLNEAGTAGCNDSIELESGNQRGLLELVDPEGQAIRVQPLGSEGWTELVLLASTDSEAVYKTAVFGGVEMVLHFTSSSTLGGQLENCADRGGEGWLLEPAG